MKPLIHFAHANGVPSKVYQKLFDQLKDQYDIIYVAEIGTDKRYPITHGWAYLVDQIIDSIVQQAQGRKVIGLGHSLGSVLTLMAAYRRPELFSQVIMLDPPLIIGKASFVFHLAKIFKPKLVDKITPAGLSVRRRDHWESREQAAELLGSRGNICPPCSIENGMPSFLFATCGNFSFKNTLSLPTTRFTGTGGLGIGNHHIDGVVLNIATSSFFGMVKVTPPRCGSLVNA